MPESWVFKNKSVYVAVVVCGGADLEEGGGEEEGEEEGVYARRRHDLERERENEG